MQNTKGMNASLKEAQKPKTMTEKNPNPKTIEVSTATYNKLHSVKTQIAKNSVKTTKSTHERSDKK